MKIALIMIGIVAAVILLFSLIVHLVGNGEEKRIAEMNPDERRKYVEAARKKEIV